MAVEYTIRRESGAGGVTFTEMVKVTYSQDWSAYNLAQTREGEHFGELLAQLCSLVLQPPQGTGRPPLPLSDMAYAMVARTYSRFSSRRFASDLRNAERAGHIGAAPSFNSLLRYQRDPAMTPILNELVTVSCLPLRAVETEFAVDSSGFGTRRTVSWYSRKHGREVKAREWVKLHLITGVRTHIVTGVEVTGWAANDAPYLSSLVRGTAANFDVREVSADKGYLTKRNAAAVEAVGAVPLIPFKSNTVAPAPDDDSPWARMWHLYSFRRAEFLEHYHRRSNVESTFAMIKAKFGDDVLGKSDTAQVNEVLCKVIAHNLCVLSSRSTSWGSTRRSARQRPRNPVSKLLVRLEYHRFVTGRAMFLFAQPTFAGGMGSVLDIGAALVHYNDVPDPELADWLAMCQDWLAVGDDLRAAMVKQLEAMAPEQLERLAQAVERHGRHSLTH